MRPTLDPDFDESEPTVRLRKDGRYEARKTIDGRSYSGYGTTPAEAIRGFRAKIAKAGRQRGYTGREPRIVDLFERFYQDHGGRMSPRTQESYRRAKTRLMPWLGKFRVSQLTKPMIRDVYRQLKLDARSIEQSHDVMNTMVNWAIKEGRLPSTLGNPFAQLEITSKRRSGRLDVLDVAQLAQLFSAMAGSYWLLLVALLAITGCRMEEALGLSWDQCHLDGPDESEPYIRFAQTSVWHSKLSRWFVWPHLKNDSSPRIVYIPRWLANAMRKERTRQTALRTGGAVFVDPWLEETVENDDARLVKTRARVQLVFVSPKNLGIVDGRYIRQPLRRGLAAAGLPMIRPHDLRHSCATNLFAAGWSPEMVSERLGHQSIVVTVQTYKAYILPLHKRMAMTQELWSGPAFPAAISPSLLDAQMVRTEIAPAASPSAPLVARPLSPQLQRGGPAALPASTATAFRRPRAGHPRALRFPRANA